jgi:PIN domain nuclease of toxin-antitoxin system
MNVVLDASAILALILKEPGSDIVAASLGGAMISSVNMAEVYSKCADRGLDAGVVRKLFTGLGVEVATFSDRHALVAGQLRTQTRSHGLSLGDRACLATAIVKKYPVITADRVWLKLGLDLDIRSIR